MPELVTRMSAARARRAMERAEQLTRDEREAVKALPVLVRTQGLIAALNIAPSGLARALAEHLSQSPIPLQGVGASRADFVAAWVRLLPSEAALVEEEAVRYAEDLKMLCKVLE
jgi:hypothetical protein